MAQAWLSTTAAGRPAVVSVTTDAEATEHSRTAGRPTSLRCAGLQRCPGVPDAGHRRGRRGGVRFGGAFTPIAMCTPARASLLTGRYPHNHLQLSNMGKFTGIFDDRLIGQPTLLSRLAGAGYRIGYTGKWHLPREGDGELCGGEALAHARRVVRPAGAARLRLRPRRGAAPGVGRVGAVRRAQQLPARADPGSVDGGPRNRDGGRVRQGRRPLPGVRLLLRPPLLVRGAGAVGHPVRPRRRCAAGQLRRAVRRQAAGPAEGVAALERRPPHLARLAARDRRLLGLLQLRRPPGGPRARGAGALGPGRQNHCGRDRRSRRHARQPPAVQQGLPHCTTRPTVCRC